MNPLHFIVLLIPLLGFSQQSSADYSLLNQKNEAIKTFQGTAPIQSIYELPVTVSATPLPVKQLLNVPLIKQNPELRYGCEVTSLAMMLQYAGANTNKMELFRKVKKDLDPIQRTSSGDIIRWGNPAEGFVGDMTGKTAGYAVFDKPMEELVNLYLPGRAVNLTNKSFDEVLQHVAKGFPVVVWTTGDYRLPDRWEAWYHGNQLIKTPLDLHAVVLVGYDQAAVYLNDPLSGRKQVRVSKQQFISSWHALQSRAISYQ